MSREIKFRQWIAYNKTMVYGAGMGEHNHGWVGFSKVNFDDNPIMQFTGLKDKNGKEIYEGDIVRFCRKHGYWSHEKGDYATVEYITDQQAQYCGFGFSVFHPLTKNKAAKVEVIGNIYETPELKP